MSQNIEYSSNLLQQNDIHWGKLIRETFICKGCNEFKDTPVIKCERSKILPILNVFSEFCKEMAKKSENNPNQSEFIFFMWIHLTAFSGTWNSHRNSPLFGYSHAPKTKNDNFRIFEFMKFTRNSEFMSV